MDFALVDRGPRGGSDRRIVLAWGLAGAALAAVGLAFLVSLSAAQVILIGAAAAGALIPLASAVARREVEPLELGVAVGFVYLILFPIRAAVVRLNLDYAANARVLSSSAHIAREALVAVTLGLVAGGLAYASPLGRRLGQRVRLPACAAAERPRLAFSLLVFGVGAVAEAILLAAARHPSWPLLGGRGSGLVSGGSALMLVGLCLLTRRAVLRPDPGPIVTAVGATAVGIGVGITGQFKEVVLLSVLVPLVMWSFTARHGIRLRWLVLAALVGVFVIFPLVSLWRYASTAEGTANPLPVAARLPHQYLHHDLLAGRPRSFAAQDVLTDPLLVTTHRLYGFDSMLLVVRYTGSEVPFQHGRTLENLAEGLIPRILWSGKPRIGIGYWFAVHYWGTPKSVLQVPQTVTHPGELWIDFGLAGVIVGMAILGVWYRFAYAALRPRESGTAALLYTVVFVTALPVDRDLPYAYVTLVQRIAVTSLILVAAALFSWVRGRFQRA